MLIFFLSTVISLNLTYLSQSLSLSPCKTHHIFPSQSLFICLLVLVCLSISLLCDFSY
ncbi:MAG: hypothetical protein BYD32DRAFT_412381 [Podila humilis]|nr:MAG: hypothetical protein BYD32DRAFT_412381 [Podila humilis]